MFDLLSTLAKTLAYSTAAVFFLLSIPFIAAHVADNWDAPIYPHSGFTPDCPSWDPPIDEVENTLPPTYYLASGDES